MNRVRGPGYLILSITLLKTNETRSVPSSRHPETRLTPPPPPGLLLRGFSRNHTNSMASLPLPDARPTAEEVSSPAAKKIKLSDASDSHAGVADIKPEY